MLTPVGYRSYRLANTEFVWALDDQPSTAEVFRTRTPPAAMTSLPHLRERLRFRTVVCLSDEDGGDVALVALVGAPARLVALLEGNEPHALDEFAQLRGIDDRVRAVSVPSMSPERVELVLSEELGSAGSDAVIDAVSAGYAAGRAMFEELFPRVRAGGCYVIERWSTEHYALHDFVAALDPADEAAIDQARAQVLEAVGSSDDLLERLLPDVLELQRRRPDVVAAVDVSRHWLVIERGPAPLDAPFSLDGIRRP